MKRPLRRLVFSSLVTLALSGCADERDAPAGEAGTLRPLRFADRGPKVREVYEYLRRYGYFPNPALEEFPHWNPVMPTELADPEYFDADLEEALRLFQLGNGLVPSGEVDRDTLRLMAMPRCNVPDYYGGATNSRQLDYAPRFVYSGWKWGKSSLSYRFLNSTPDLPVGDQRWDIARALDRWAAVTNLGFWETGSGGDITIGFYYGDHGDGAPFDQQYGVLAHAFYPSNGRTHFDEAEKWSRGSSGIDLATVALHEFGHTIGLDHSPNQAAIMYAAYTGPRPNLHNDDIQGAKSIYGRKPIDWSSAGPVGGRFCTQIHEGSDPDTWQDNWLCSTVDHGIKWSSAGPIGGMKCTQITEGSEPPEHTWNDNFLCVPNGSPLNFQWSSAGPIAGKTCTMWDEGSDPHTWQDNFLCY